MSDEIVPLKASAPQWFSTRGRLLIKRCDDCGGLHHYPRPLCPFCMSSNTEWVEAQGTGVIYTFSVVRQKEGSFVLAWVTLDEGVSLMSHIVGCDASQVSIGRRVSMVREEREGNAVPVFQLVSEGQ